MKLRRVASLAVASAIAVVVQVWFLTRLVPPRSSSLSPRSPAAPSLDKNTTTLEQELWMQLLECRDTSCVDGKIAALYEKESVDDMLWQANYQYALERQRLDPYSKDHPEKDSIQEATTTMGHHILAEGHIPLLQSHPALQPLLAEYQPAQQWRDGYPDISIIGMPKAGTSQLYRILASHPDVAAFHDDQKEYCLDLPDTNRFESATADTDYVDSSTRTYIQSRLYSWHQQLYQDYLHLTTRHNSTTSQQPLTVNGCVNTKDLWLHLHYLPPNDDALPLGRNSNDDDGKNNNHNKLFIMLLRDPADLVWAAWNFYALPGHDAPATKASLLDDDETNTWAHPRHHYRSPELFDELTMSGRNLLLKDIRLNSVRMGRRLLKLAGGRQNVLFLRNEDLLPDVVDASGGLLDRLCQFTGLECEGFRGVNKSNTVLQSFTNCNDNKGVDRDCSRRRSHGSNSAAYEIAGHRAMLESTRQHIYFAFLEECKVWRDEFGVEYPGCLNVLENHQNRQ